MSKRNFDDAERGIKSILAKGGTPNEKKLGKIMGLLHQIFYKNPVQKQQEEWEYQQRLEDDPHLQRMRQAKPGCLAQWCECLWSSKLCCCPRYCGDGVCCMGGCAFFTYILYLIMQWVVVWYKPAGHGSK